jgi:hypothetical protein
MQAAALGELAESRMRARLFARPFTTKIYESRRTQEWVTRMAGCIYHGKRKMIGAARNKRPFSCRIGKPA